jgi:hypothetical protein
LGNQNCLHGQGADINRGKHEQFNLKHSGNHTYRMLKYSRFTHTLYLGVKYNLQNVMLLNSTS